jgi:hypothetical protein
VPDRPNAGPSVGPAAWVYFQGTDNGLWKVRADGSKQSNIGNNTTASSPFVVPDPNGGPNWVYFQGTDNKLWKVRDDGSQQSQIGCPASCNTTASTPFVVPDPKGGPNWVYFRGTGNGLSSGNQLWKVRDDGSQQSQIGCPASCNTTASTPFVVPDPNGGANWVYFQGTDSKLWKVRDDGSQQSQIGCPASCNTTASMPFVVPDPKGGANWVYFQGTGGSSNLITSGSQLWKVRDDGSQQSQIGCPASCNRTASTPFVLPNPNGGPNWVYFQGTDNTLWQIRDDGTLQSAINGGTSSMPFVTPDGWVYTQRGNTNQAPGGGLWEAPSILVDPDPVTTWINSYAQVLYLMGGKGVALGTDADGLSPLIQQDVVPTQYPFTLNFCPPSPALCFPKQLGQYTFGKRTLNFQSDGIANYGMLPDFIQAASQNRPGFMNGSVAPTAQIAALFNSAEDTIEMWEAVEKVAPTLSDYHQTANGTLTVDISSATQFGRVVSPQPVYVGGTLDIVLQNGFVPQVGQTFVIMTAPNVSGTFSIVNGTVINAGEKFVVQYTGSSIVLNVLPP